MPFYINFYLARVRVTSQCFSDPGLQAYREWYIRDDNKTRYMNSREPIGKWFQRLFCKEEFFSPTLETDASQLLTFNLSHQMMDETSSAPQSAIMPGEKRYINVKLTLGDIALQLLQNSKCEVDKVIFGFGWDGGQVVESASINSIPMIIEQDNPGLSNPVFLTDASWNSW